jgi:hypothetical protein
VEAKPNKMTEVMKIPGIVEKNGKLFFNGEEVKSIKGMGNDYDEEDNTYHQKDAFDHMDSNEYFPDLGTKEENRMTDIETLKKRTKITPIKKITEIKSIEEISQILPVKNIQEIKHIQEIKNMEEIKDEVAREFITKQGLKDIIEDGKDYNMEKPETDANKELITLLNEIPETYVNRELKDLLNKMYKQDIIEAKLDDVIVKEKSKLYKEESKLGTLEKIKQKHEVKKKEELSALETLKIQIENKLNAQANSIKPVKDINEVKSINHVKSLQELNSLTPIRTLKKVKSMTPIKNIQEVKNMYSLTEEQAHQLEALIAGKVPTYGRR